MTEEDRSRAGEQPSGTATRRLIPGYPTDGCQRRRYELERIGPAPELRPFGDPFDPTLATYREIPIDEVADRFRCYCGWKAHAWRRADEPPTACPNPCPGCGRRLFFASQRREW